MRSSLPTKHSLTWQAMCWVMRGTGLGGGGGGAVGEDAAHFLVRERETKPKDRHAVDRTKGWPGEEAAHSLIPQGLGTQGQALESPVRVLTVLYAEGVATQRWHPLSLESDTCDGSRATAGWAAARPGKVLVPRGRVRGLLGGFRVANGWGRGEQSGAGVGDVLQERWEAESPGRRLPQGSTWGVMGSPGEQPPSPTLGLYLTLGLYTAGVLKVGFSVVCTVLPDRKGGHLFTREAKSTAWVPGPGKGERQKEVHRVSHPGCPSCCLP